MDYTTINNLSAESFLVKDDSLYDINAPFLCWLHENGFKLAWHKGHYDSCNWVYINITHRLFAYGMPGVKIVQAIGGHAITIKEFLMIWDIYDKYDGLELLAMDEAEQKDRHTIQYLVRTGNAVSRKTLIEFIEKDGLICKEDYATNRQTVLDSKLPLIINVTDGYYSMLHTITSAACACSSRSVIKEDEFYLYYKYPNITYEEYFNLVKRYFMENGYDEKTADDFFNTEETTVLLRNHFECYINQKGGGYSPSATAYCLYMLY